MKADVGARRVFGRHWRKIINHRTLTGAMWVGDGVDDFGYVPSAKPMLRGTAVTRPRLLLVVLLVSIHLLGCGDRAGVAEDDAVPLPDSATEVSADLSDVVPSDARDVEEIPDVGSPMVCNLLENDWQPTEGFALEDGLWTLRSPVEVDGCELRAVSLQLSVDHSLPYGTRSLLEVHMCNLCDADKRLAWWSLGPRPKIELDFLDYYLTIALDDGSHAYPLPCYSQGVERYYVGDGDGSSIPPIVSIANIPSASGVSLSEYRGDFFEYLDHGVHSSAPNMPYWSAPLDYANIAQIVFQVPVLWDPDQQPVPDRQGEAACERAGLPQSARRPSRLSEGWEAEPVREIAVAVDGLPAPVMDWIHTNWYAAPGE